MEENQAIKKEEAFGEKLVKAEICDDEWMLEWSGHTDKLKEENLDEDEEEAVDNEGMLEWSEVADEKPRFSNSKSPVDKVVKKELDALKRECLIREPLVRLKDVMKRKLDTSKENSNDVEIMLEAKSSCVFECPKCLEKFFTWWCLNKHFSATGHGASKDVKNAARFVSKKVLFRCQLCSELIICDFAMISRHVKGMHNMSMPEYRTKFALKHSKRYTWQERMLEELATGQIESKDPTSKCTFKCPTCSKSFSSWKILGVHFYSEAKHEGFLSCERLSESITHIVSHRCLICQKVLLCDAHFIVRHVRQDHNLTMKKYKDICVTKGNKENNLPKLTDLTPEILQDELSRGATVTEVPKDMCKFSCPVCKFEAPSYSLLRCHLAKFGHQPAEQIGIMSLLRKVTVFRCTLCREAMLSETTVIGAHLSERHGRGLTSFARERPFTSKREERRSMMREVVSEAKETNQEMSNKCLYRCPECSEYFHGWRVLNQHFKTSGHHGIQENYLKLKEFVVKVVAYQCLICKEPLLSDSYFVSSHVRYYHKLSVEQYTNKYVNGTSKSVRTNYVLEKGSLSSRSIGNFCLFHCVCQKEFKSMIALNYHLKDANHGPVDWSGGNRYLAKTVTHACLICQKLLLCDSSVLRDHLRAHKIKSLREYCEKTKCELSNQVTEVKERFKDVTTVSTVPGNLCEFQCKSCRAFFGNLNKLRIHRCVNKGQRIKMKEIRKHLTKAVLYQCPYCGERLLCDRNVIGSHLNRRHKMCITDLKQ